MAERSVESTRAESSRSDGYATGRATKKAIVAKAAEAFAQKGFYGASLRSIAREAGVDHSTLMHHFGNKTALLLAVIEWHDQQQFRAEFPMRISAEGLVDAFVNAAEANRATPGLVQLLSMLTAEAGAEDHPARPALQRRHKRLVTIFAWMIKRQRNKLDLPDDGTTPEQRAALVISTWDGLQLFDALNPGTLDVPTMVGRTLREAFGLPLDG
ncbi:TetR/AcrR family transcriptional regulator [Microbacterium sp. C7(2022)]|uniref:TetR/AcrR family transcriptional regulator n=1 Tax=Microbacterium sp. C7(2022) TaxID=2992759 RepID=UPI00237A582E|nr:TetR/AcrR family transcriptional regulator [Microbacterium sp. C7(2022)]MDE0546237.1 TetR/AcrR family transcriptional regulator [Microbacterium sp. C7(2022)]